MSLLGLEDSPIQVYGWIQNSFTGNPSQPADGINFGVTPNYKANEWMGNQYYTVFENALEHDGEFNFGFRADVLFGHDWEFNKMKGVFDGAWPSGYFPGLDLAQFYGEMHLPILTEGGLDVKFGRWYTLHGYEVVPAIGRPLLSVPYMFTYGQPFTHWGLMTNWNVTDNLVIYNGIPQGWDTFQIQSRAWGYMGGFSWTGARGQAQPHLHLQPKRPHLQPLLLRQLKHHPAQRPRLLATKTSTSSPPSSATSGPIS